MKSRLAASDALYLKPLLFGLDRSDSPFDLIIDFPANNSLNLSKRSGGIRNAFLSPIDYARHGAEYRIVPQICVASSEPTGTVQLILKSGLKNIERIAVDIRFTSEIILANIILLEKYRNESSHLKHQFIPMTPDIDAMLAKADAALLVQDDPESLGRENTYTLDLVEEWVDLTGLPYVHGFWVGRDGDLLPLEIQALLTAKQDGLRLKSQIAQTVALQKKCSLDDLTHYIAAFSYDFGKREEESLAEFMHYAFFHGIIGDVPEITFFDVESNTQMQN